MTRPDIEAIDALVSKATQGEWSVDSEEMEGEGGVGPDTYELKYSSYFVQAGNDVLFDAHNSEATEIHEESDLDEYCAWDETGERNMNAIVALHNNWPAIRDYIAELEKDAGRLYFLCEHRFGWLSSLAPKHNPLDLNESALSCMRRGIDAAIAAIKEKP